LALLGGKLGLAIRMPGVSATIETGMKSFSGFTVMSGSRLGLMEIVPTLPRKVA
jgi:hypothetical protein